MSPSLSEANHPEIDVSSIEDLNRLIEFTNAAQEKFATFSQDQVDKIFMEVAKAAVAARLPLAKMAIAETNMGVLEDKVIKNHFAEEVYNAYKNSKTCGIIERDKDNGVLKIAAPFGTIAGITYSTSPTSTTIFKALLALKTRNAIVFSPHVRAKECSVAACRILHEAAVAAGAPRGVIGWIANPTVELSNALMKHNGIHMIIASGTPSLLKAAYSCGKPALAAGMGNTPVIIDESADIRMAIHAILVSKTFDNGLVCFSEQSIIVVDSVYEQVKKDFIEAGCHFCNDEERVKLVNTIIFKQQFNLRIVGRSAYEIAQMAGFSVPQNTKVLMAAANTVGVHEPFSYPKYSPILGFYNAASFEEALVKAESLLKFRGTGHTASLFTNPDAVSRIEAFGARVTAGRLLINQPCCFGAVGGSFNIGLDPSFTLGAGSYGGTSTSENISVKHLIKIKTVTTRCDNMT
ncbi:hypothetical protein GEMRC1_006812 [Eukaryota sp. GEM-RC1]